MGPENDRGGNGGGIALALFAGMAIGAIIGILFAPKAGIETRRELMEKGEKLIIMGKEGFTELTEKSKDLADVGKQKMDEIKITSEEIWEKSKRKVENAAKVIKDMVEEGKSTAKETEDFLS